MPRSYEIIAPELSKYFSRFSPDCKRPKRRHIWSRVCYGAFVAVHEVDGALTVAPLHIAPSVCPHDCTSTCALDVEILDGRTIGRVRGSRRNAYTAGVICEKVARYAERVHHADRLTQPLLRDGPKGGKRLEAHFLERGARSRGGSFPGQGGASRCRDGLAVFLRGHHGLGAARRHQPVAPCDEVLAVALDDLRGAVRQRLDGRGGQQARRRSTRSSRACHVGGDLGGNPVNTQVNVMHHATAAKKRGAKLVVVDPYRTGTAEKADLHLPVRPGTDGALACAMMNVLFAEGLRGLGLPASLHRLS